MDKLGKVLKIFEQPKNESLFSICIDQIAEMYVLEPKKYQYHLIQKIKDFVFNKANDKRIIGAQILDKIFSKIGQQSNKSAYIHDLGDLKIYYEQILIESYKGKKKRNVIFEELEKYFKIDFLDVQ